MKDFTRINQNLKNFDFSRKMKNTTAFVIIIFLSFTYFEQIQGFYPVTSSKHANYFNYNKETAITRTRSCYKPSITNLSMMSSLNDKMNNEDWEFEREVEELNHLLDFAVSQENYHAAAKVRDKLSVIHLDELSSILKTNKEFYESFLRKDAQKMSKIWLKSEDVMCIHPNQEVIGYNNVVNAWRKAFLADKAKRKSIKLSNVAVQVHGTTGWVTCTEEVTGDLDKKKDIQVGSTLHSTNLFQKSAGQWYLVHRHCTKDMDNKAMSLQELLSGGGMGGSTPTIINLRGQQPGQMGGGASNLGGLIEKIQSALNKKMQSKDEQDESDDDEEEEITVNLGSSSDGGMVVMGGALVEVEIDGDDDDDDSDGIFTIEQLGGGDDDDDEIIELDEVRARKLRDMMDQEKNKRKKKVKVIKQVDEEDEHLQAQTINAIRRLHNEGRITLDQKRKLLTDIIKHASGTEASSTEMAFELLMADNEDWSNADFVDEFADQCRAIADSIP
mmetsp:Transcript_40714/g.53628  ORF Transcript_40714/g.53628 Transcript_40714/m.53628 type:complete len:500 (-) Transcript_40714:490-1989(-)